MSIYSSFGAYAYILSSAETTTTNAGQYYLLAGTFTNERLMGFEIGVNGLTYLGCNNLLAIMLNATFSTDTNNTIITMALFKNGVLQANSEMTNKLNQTTDKGNIALADVLEVTTNDYIDIRIKSDKDGAKIIAEKANTIAMRFL